MPFPRTPSPSNARAVLRLGQGVRRSDPMIINVTAASDTRTALNGRGGNTPVANFTTTKFTPQIAAIRKRDASTNQTPGPDGAIGRPGVVVSPASSLMREN